MTCIVAVRGEGVVWMAADSQATNNGAVMLHALPKVVRRAVEPQGSPSEPMPESYPTLFGSDGTIWLGDYFRWGELPPRIVGMSLAEWCSQKLAPCLRTAATEGNHWVERNSGKEWGGQTLVACGTDIVLMDSAGSVVVPQGNFWAIGSGGAEARGALHVLYRHTTHNAYTQAEAAVLAACELDDGCRRPIELIASTNNFYCEEGEPYYEREG